MSQGRWGRPRQLAITNCCTVLQRIASEVQRLADRLVASGKGTLFAQQNSDSSTNEQSQQSVTALASGAGGEIICYKDGSSMAGKAPPRIRLAPTFGRALVSSILRGRPLPSPRLCA
jgi:hypothetical protein